MWWECPKIQFFWQTIGHALSQILGVVIPVESRLMLLADLEHFPIRHPILLANLLLTSSLLITGKSIYVPALHDWTTKIQNIWLLSKISAM